MYSKARRRHNDGAGRRAKTTCIAGVSRTHPWIRRAPPRLPERPPSPANAALDGTARLCSSPMAVAKPQLGVSTRERLARTALRLFAERGFNGVSNREIVEA